MAEMGKLDHLEERLKAIERGEDYAFANLKELFLEPNIITPPKFKVLDFDKYKGTTCPKNHLKMYCRKMGAYVKDEELLIHSFLWPIKTINLFGVLLLLAHSITFKFAYDFMRNHQLPVAWSRSLWHPSIYTSIETISLLLYPKLL